MQLEPISVVANGVRHRVGVGGQAGAPWLVFIHSLACHRGMWSPQLDAFADRFAILTYDVRGHGESEVPPGPYTMDQLSEDLSAILAHRKIARFNLVGLSMGGMIGQAFALRNPGKIDSLLLAGTASRWPAAAAPVWKERIDAAKRNGIAPLVEPALGRWFTAEFRSRCPAIVDGVAAMMLSTAVEGYVGCSEAIARIDFTARLKHLNFPVHILVGNEDLGTPPSLAFEMHQAIPASTLEILDHAAHLTNIEQPQRFNASLTRLLQRAGEKTSAP